MLSNAKANAMKYTANSNAGFNSQGYGSSLQNGTYNSYLEAMANARNNYNTNMSNIARQEDEANKAELEDRFQSVTTMISQATDADSLDNLMRDYNYLDNNGNLVKPDNMSDDDWNQIKYYYSMQKNALGNSNNYTGATYTSEDAFKNATFYTDDGKKLSMSNNFNKERKILWGNINSGKYQYGTIIKMQDKAGYSVYVKFTESGLQFSTESDYNQSNAKSSIIYKNGKFYDENNKEITETESNNSTKKSNNIGSVVGNFIMKK